MSITNLTDENFNEFISNKSLPIMVDFMHNGVVRVEHYRHLLIESQTNVKVN